MMRNRPRMNLYIRGAHVSTPKDRILAEGEYFTDANRNNDASVACGASSG